jgi:hypothetical protein
MNSPHVLKILAETNHLPSFGGEPNVPLSEAFSATQIETAIENYRWMLGAPQDLSVTELFDIPRCRVADFTGNAYTDQFGALQDTGSGSWRVGCSPDWPQNHSAVYRVDKSRMPAYLRESFETAWDLMATAYANVGLVILRNDTGNVYNSLVTFEPGRGWIGLAIVGRNQTCSTRMWAKFDTSYGRNFTQDRLVNQWAFLLAHELGHNCGAGHTRGGIMNASLINGIFYPDQWRRSDPLLATLRRWYGGNPVDVAPIWTIPSPEQPRE